MNTSELTMRETTTLLLALSRAEAKEWAEENDIDLEEFVQNLFHLSLITAEDYYRLLDELPDDHVLLNNGDVEHSDDAIFVEYPYRHEGYYSAEDFRVVYCEDEEIFALSDYCTRHDGEWYTDDHYSEHFDNCHHCEETFRTGDLNNDGLCSDCASIHTAVKPYSTNVLDFLPMGKRDGRFCGIEWETEAGDYDNLAEMLSNDAILKEDGSLDDGAEIVSRPLSLPAMLDFLTVTYDAIVKTDCAWQTTCGFHVHIEREGLDFDTTCLAQFFVMANYNLRFMERIGGRMNNKFAKLGLADEYPYSQGGRYEAFNHYPSNTVEFRFFTGRHSLESRKQNVIFCHALIDFCEFVLPLTQSIANAEIPQVMTMTNFITWLSSHEKELYRGHAEWLKWRLGNLL